MPVYEYQCNKCGEVLEYHMKFSDPTPDTCKGCGEKAELKKMLSRTAFVLKGEGWYVTDFRDNKKSKDQSSSPGSQNGAAAKTEASTSSDNSTSTSDSGSSASAKSDAKPAASAASKSAE